MDCELCGKRGAFKKINFEGSEMIVCDSCSSYGRLIEEKKPQTVFQQKTFAGQKNFSPNIDDAVDLVSDYGKIIRHKREQLGLNIADFSQKLYESPSVIQRIENQSLEPDEKLLSKLQKVYGIKLKALKSQ